MDKPKLEKVNDRLYHEPYKDGKGFKWKKEPRFLSITLTDIRTELCLGIERPETNIRLFRKESQHENAEQNTPSASAEDEDEKYSQRFDWRIVGKGHLNEDGIGLIKEDGTLSTRAEELENTDVILKAVADSEKEKAHGYVFYSDAKFEKRSNPYVCMELFVPKTQFDTICEELVSGRLSELKLGVHIDAFESEVDSTLREPGMRKAVYIEEDSLLNKAYLSWLAGSRLISSGVSSESPSDPKELFDTEGFHEQKINYFGKWLLGVEDGFNATAKGLYKALLLAATGYLIFRGLAWLLN